MTRSGNTPEFGDWRPLTGWKPSPEVLAETLAEGMAKKAVAHMKTLKP